MTETPPYIQKTGVGTYYGNKGSVPRASAIPTVIPWNNVAIPALVVSVATDGKVTLRRASNPGVDTFVLDNYKTWIRSGCWIYVTAQNRVVKVINLAQMFDHTAIGYVENTAILPAVAWVNEPFQAIHPSVLGYGYAVTGTAGAIVDGISLAQGVSINEPETWALAAHPFAFDCSAANQELTIKFSTATP